MAAMAAALFDATKASEASEEQGVERMPDGSPLLEDDHHDHHDDAPMMGKTKSMQVGNPECMLSLYGEPLSSEAVTAAHAPGEGGLVWHAQMVPDDWQHPKQCTPDGQIKPRRSNLAVHVSEFFRSLVQGTDGRWIFCGVLNGWPGLTCLELRAVTQKEKGKSVKRVWDADHATGEPPPRLTGGSVRLTLRMPPWSSRGWTEDCKGYVFWFFSQRPPSVQSKTSFGEGMIEQLEADLEAEGRQMPRAVSVHLFAHRYALGKGKRETAKDLLTYHSAVLVTWDHGLYTTVVELAILNAVGGYRGKANWHADRDAPASALYSSLPAQMVLPWIDELAEIRCHDVPSRDMEQFKEFISLYTGPEKRFLDPHFQHSGPVRLRHRTQEDVMMFLINYIQRDRRYTQQFRNCQAFAADFYSFMAGKKGIEPFGMITRRTYKPRSHLFLYEPSMYEQGDGNERTEELDLLGNAPRQEVDGKRKADPVIEEGSAPTRVGCFSCTV